MHLFKHHHNTTDLVKENLVKKYPDKMLLLKSEFKNGIT